MTADFPPEFLGCLDRVFAKRDWPSKTLPTIPLADKPENAPAPLYGIGQPVQYRAITVPLRIVNAPYFLHGEWFYECQMRGQVKNGGWLVFSEKDLQPLRFSADQLVSFLKKDADEQFKRMPG